MNRLIRICIFLVLILLIQGCGTTKRFYKTGDCETIEGGYVCQN